MSEKDTMSTSHAKHGASPHDYEERALPLRLLGGWMIGLYVGLGAVCAFVYFVYGTPKMRPVPDLVLNRPMNQPALQVNGAADLKVFLAQQKETLSTYGWVNRSQGIVRVPISQAIDMVLKKGLPSRGAKP